MKLFKKIKKFFKNCIIILGVIIIGSHLTHSLSISYEARAQIAPSVKESTQPSTFIEAISDQVERNEEAAERYERNRTEAVKHRANQIELKKLELEQMENQGYGIKGDPIADTITLARYNARKQCLKYDWKLGSFASEDEIMRMAEIQAKKVEGEKLTDEEIAFYAYMKGTVKDITKVDESYEKAETKKQEKVVTKKEKSLEVQKRQDALYKKRNVITDNESKEVSNFCAEGVTRSERGKKVVYTFENQDAVIANGGVYISHITSNPTKYVMRIKDQRVDSRTYKRLNQELVDYINSNGLAISCTSPTYGDIEVYFVKGNASKNKIARILTPESEESIEAISAPKEIIVPRPGFNRYDKSGSLMDKLNESTKTAPKKLTPEEQRYQDKLKALEKKSEKVKSFIHKITE